MVSCFSSVPMPVLAQRVYQYMAAVHASCYISFTGNLDGSVQLVRYSIHLQVLSSSSTTRRDRWTSVAGSLWMHRRQVGLHCHSESDTLHMYNHAAVQQSTLFYAHLMAKSGMRAKSGRRNTLAPRLTKHLAPYIEACQLF